MRSFFRAPAEEKGEEKSYEISSYSMSTLAEIHAIVSEIYNLELLHLYDSDNDPDIYHEYGDPPDYQYHKLCENLNLHLIMNELENLFTFLNAIRNYLESYQRLKAQHLNRMSCEDSLKEKIETGEHVCLQLQNQSQALEIKLADYILLLASKEGTLPESILDKVTQHFTRPLSDVQPANLADPLTLEEICMNYFYNDIQSRHQSLLAEINSLPSVDASSSHSPKMTK
ncbi:MAG: hypothetical protein P4M12_06645 [Gammaproteobacteria bacterium]|nr:hypothetical protein [Gammaproteobacteria bacterium]